MSGYTLAPGISFCDAGDRHVFLDLNADRYFCLGTAAERAFACLLSRTPLGASDQAQLSTLVRQGLLRPAPIVCLSSASISWTRASRSLHESTVGVSTASIATAAATLFRARWSLHLFSLKHLIDRVRIAKSRCGVQEGDREDRLIPIAVAFRKAALLTGSLNQCLASSLAISHGATAKRVATELVLGVKLRPFQAHAWVQAGELLISDPVDRVAPFEPILII